MKKQIALIATLLCLFSATKAFSQCIISGGNLKTPVEYQTLADVEKDSKKLVKAIKKDDLLVKTPVGSAFRNENDLIKLFELLQCNKEQALSKLNLADLQERLEYCEKSDFTFCLSYNKSDSKITLNFYTGLMASSIYARTTQEYKNNKMDGYGYVSNAERNKIIDRIRELKNEYDEKIQNARKSLIKSKLAELKKNAPSASFYKKAAEYEAKKELAYALFYYFKAEEAEKNESVDSAVYNQPAPDEEKIIAEYEEKLNNLITELKISINFKNEYAESNSEEYNGYRRIKLDSNILIEEEKKTSKYDEIMDFIKQGQPGSGNFSAFALHDGWKNLLMNAEKLANEYPPDTFSIGKLHQKELDYKTKTATYTTEINITSWPFGNSYWIRYWNSKRRSVASLDIIEKIGWGYNEAWKEDWTDLPKPKFWPIFSASGLASNNELVNGVAVYRSATRTRYELIHTSLGGGKIYPKEANRIFNAFACCYAGCNGQPAMGLYDLKLNIVDETGKELVKPKRILCSSTGDSGGLQGELDFEGISPEIMEKIDSGKAKVNLVAVYLEYGSLSENDKSYANTNTERAFIKNFKEIEIPVKNISLKINIEKKKDVEIIYY